MIESLGGSHAFSEAYPQILITRLFNGVSEITSELKELCEKEVLRITKTVSFEKVMAHPQII